MAMGGRMSARSAGHINHVKCIDCGIKFEHITSIKLVRAVRCEDCRRKRIKDRKGKI
jgi:DNA-directed RNA polymerase subunit RPC12/RpoP